MLDPLLLKNDLDSLKDNLKRRNLDVDLEQLIELDESRRKLRFEAEKLRADQKSLGKDIANAEPKEKDALLKNCLLYTSPSPRDKRQSRMPSSA